MDGLVSVRSRRSPIYSHIWYYRAVMNLLYMGTYRQRFLDIIGLMGRDVGSVCDLCFGDTVIAEWCHSQGIRWTGIDINPGFCRRARRLGFEVIEGDVLAVELREADVFVMAGSLYHFHSRLSALFDAIFRHTRRFILSEPIRNVSCRGGVLGWGARRAANAGSGQAAFRYSQRTLLEALEEQRRLKAFTLRVVSVDRDMVVEMVR